MVDTQPRMQRITERYEREAEYRLLRAEIEELKKRVLQNSTLIEGILGGRGGGGRHHSDPSARPVFRVIHGEGSSVAYFSYGNLLTRLRLRQFHIPRPAFRTAMTVIAIVLAFTLGWILTPPNFAGAANRTSGNTNSGSTVANYHPSAPATSPSPGHSP